MTTTQITPAFLRYYAKYQNPATTGTSIIELDQELLRRHGGHTTDYMVDKAGIFLGATSTTEIIKRFCIRIAARKAWNKLQGHRRARMIARQRDYANAQEWHELTTAILIEFSL